jgi:hypothetical protein
MVNVYRMTSEDDVFVLTVINEHVMKLAFNECFESKTLKAVLVFSGYQDSEPVIDAGMLIEHQLIDLRELVDLIDVDGDGDVILKARVC